MTVKKVDLKRISPNPWQTRLGDDGERVAKLAESIVRDGLLQVPVGRRTMDAKTGKDIIQLAFGMGRLAAFKLLAAGELRGLEYDPADYAEMPVDVKKLSARRMFELAVLENAQRHDLTPIEEARAMRRLMDEFGAKRTEAARLFGITPGSVSNKLALLDLPADVQERVHRGEIPERTARTLLPLARKVPPIVSELAGRLAEEKHPQTVEAMIRTAMQKSLLLLAKEWDLGRVKSKLWYIEDADWKGMQVDVKHAKRAIKDLADPPGAGGVFHLRPQGNSPSDLKVSAFASLVLKQAGNGFTLDDLVKLHGYPEEPTRRIFHLLSPPACSACRFHSVTRGDHFCALDACFKVKKENVLQMALKRVRKKRALRGLAVYDKRADGPYIAHPGGSMWSYGDRRAILEAAFAEAITAKDPDLRLRATVPTWNAMQSEGFPVTESEFVELVAVGALLERINEKLGVANDTSTQSQEERLREDRRRRRAVDALLSEAVPHLAAAWRDLKGPALLATVIALDGGFQDGVRALDEPYFEDQESLKPREITAALQRRAAGIVLYSVLRWTQPEPKDVAAEIGALAERLEVEMPDDWAAGILARYSAGADEADGDSA